MNWAAASSSSAARLNHFNASPSSFFGYERFEHPAVVAPMNGLYAKEWSQFTNHFKPTFKLLKREEQNGRTKRIYEKQPQTPYERLRGSPDIPEATKVKLREQHAGPDPYELNRSIETKLKKLFTLLGNQDRESTKT